MDGKILQLRNLIIYINKLIENGKDFEDSQKGVLSSLVQLIGLVPIELNEIYVPYFENTIISYKMFNLRSFKDFKLQIKFFLIPEINRLILDLEDLN